MEGFMVGLITFFMLMNSVVWFAISVLLLYNLYDYTRDKAAWEASIESMKNIMHMSNPFLKWFTGGK